MAGSLNFMFGSLKYIIKGTILGELKSLSLVWNFYLCVIMKKSKLFYLLLMLWLPLAETTAQGIPLSSWREHLPYLTTMAVSASAGRVYCAAGSSVFYYDESDNTINRLSTISGLSDVEVSTLKYNTKTNTLLIAYRNGNIDLLVNNNEIINVAFIKKSDIVGNKTINRIEMVEELAYLSCGFGIVVFDSRPAKREIKETYFIGDTAKNYAVYDVAVTPDTIFAVTEKGLFKGPRERNLADYRSWIRDEGLPPGEFSLIEIMEGRFFVNEKKGQTESDVVYISDGGSWQEIGEIGDTSGATTRNYDFTVSENELLVSQDYTLWSYTKELKQIEKIFTYGDQASPRPNGAIKRNGYYWIADRASGLVKLADNYRIEMLTINSPETDRVFFLDILQGHVWLAAGGYTANFGNLFYWPILSHYENNEWSNVSRTTEAWLDSVFDLVTVAIDPNDPAHVFAGSWGRGLLELKNEEVVKVYDGSNQTEHSLLTRNDGEAVFVGGLSYDEQGNLWISNSFNSRLLSVYTAEGEWRSFSLQGIANADAAVAHILADANNNVWMLQHRDDRIIVYNHNGTPLDVSDDPPPVALSNSEGSGNLPGDHIFCITEDRNGEVWVGTNKGVAVFYNPGAIFNGGNYDAQQIFIQQDGTTQILFATEAVTAIAVDGANRKWIGTQNAGVFLMSADGTEELLHFYTDNSPLFSNNIHTIEIDHLTGEVYIGTDKGLISYKGTATEPQDKISKVTVYPNPVKPEYTGLIAINGLTERTLVKITDVSGALVYETESLGGQAVWDGKNFDGERVATGVYLIFASGNNGEETNVSKVMILN